MGLDPIWNSLSNCCYRVQSILCGTCPGEEEEQFRPSFSPLSCRAGWGWGVRTCVVHLLSSTPFLVFPLPLIRTGDPSGWSGYLPETGYLVPPTSKSRNSSTTFSGRDFH